MRNLAYPYTSSISFSLSQGRPVQAAEILLTCEIVAKRLEAGRSVQTPGETSLRARTFRISNT